MHFIKLQYLATQNGGVLEQLFDVELISLFSKLLLERSCRVASDFMNLSNFAQKQIEYNTSICPGNETVRKQWQKLGRHRFSQLFIPLNHTIRSPENKNQETLAKSQSRKRVVQSVCPDESSTTIDSVHVLKQVQSKDGSDASILCDFVYREFRRACKKRNVDRLDVSEFVCDPNSFDKTVRNMFYLSFLINDDILVLRMTDEIHADLMLHSTAEDVANVDAKYCTQVLMMIQLCLAGSVLTTNCALSIINAPWTKNICLFAHHRPQYNECTTLVITSYANLRADVILEKRAKLISALPVKSCRCMENYQGCSENVSWAIMVNGHANQIAHVPELFLNDTQVKIDELMPNNQQL
ncbi:hypothetical protein T10_7594 [Trichinella papuae]|uniref:Non-structural maintenance of chromosome element 4 C-terminal domain-containing protein n=1 Tax=Trichinella papuae TaxID=268474 RepID=A0A0V1MII6_9BILA|nr:hypothetical protein T10_7594 [Trichinella papuae]